MNKRIKKKKETMKQWCIARTITVSNPMWKRRKARMKMGKPPMLHIALIGTTREALQRLETSVKLTQDEDGNPDKVLFEKDATHPCDLSYLNGTFGSQKTTP